MICWRRKDQSFADDSSPLSARLNPHRTCAYEDPLMRFAGCAIVCVTLAGCWSSTGSDEVVAYTAHDVEFSQPIYRQFTGATGIEVLPKFDVESTKTVGLTNAIIAEAKRPRCDVFWNNEILNTIRLEREGLLEDYRSPTAQDFPEAYRSPSGTWHGFAARARILIVNTKVVSEARTSHERLRPARREVERQDRHCQAAVRHHRHARRLPVRRCWASSGPRNSSRN